MDESGFVDFKDFSVFSAQWKKKTDCCEDINSIANPFDNANWEQITLANIYPACGIYDCWIYGEDFSDPCYDSCGHSVYECCCEIPDFDYTCAFNYWYDGFRIGLCVYTCGINDFEVIKNKGQCRMIMARHRTRDDLENPSVCDEGTHGKYNWQIVLTDLFTRTKYGFCRESYTKPGYYWGWQSSEGETGPCKYTWW
jgi:hypothetical protein